jgi:hypothetical protein
VRTINRRKQDREFRRRVTETRDEMFASAAGQLAFAASGAVLTLVELLVKGTPTVRLQAARSILEFGSKLRDQVEMEARLAEVESRMLVA